MKGGGDVKSIIPKLMAGLRKLKPYAGVALFLLFAGVYGFLLVRINALSSPSIDDSEVLTQAKATPRINAKDAQQLEKLEDNSVNVQTLFEQGRKNPFQE